MNVAMTFLFAWVATLLLAIPYVNRVKHRDQRWFAAYLIFVSVLSAGTFGLFVGLAPFVTALTGSPSGFGSLLGTVVFFAICAAVAAWPATCLARKPPMKSPRI